MTQVIWDDKYCIGIDTIDEQHKKLFELTNRVYIASEQDVEIDDLLGIFEELKEYTQYHFEAEEVYFSALPPHEAERHKKEHEYFISELESSIQQSKRIGGLSLGLQCFISDWLVNHILIEDQKYKS